MKHVLTCLAALLLTPQAALRAADHTVTVAAAMAESPRLKAYHTRLPFDDHGFTGKYADIVVELPAMGQFVFSREFGYQPYWIPAGGRLHSVVRLIPRKGDGPDQRPDNHNIAGNAAIVARTDTSVTIRWRYAPDITLPSFTDFPAAYNQAGNPSPFYAEYAEETFNIHENGSVVRIVKNGCRQLDNWNDPGNRIEQTLQLNADGIQQLTFQPAGASGAKKQPVAGEPVRNGWTDHLVRHWRFDEGAGDTTRESQSGQSCAVGGAKAWWRAGVSGTCLSFDSYSNMVVLPAAHTPKIEDEITLSAWIAVQERPFNLAAIVDHLSSQRGYFLGLDAEGRIEFKVGDGVTAQSAITGRVPLYEWVHVVAVAQRGKAMTIYLNGKPAVSQPSAPLADAPETELSLGMTRSSRQFPLFAERQVTKQFQTAMVFSGLIDEVKLFNKVLGQAEVGSEYAALRPANARPLKPWVLPAGPEVSPGFRAEYTNLNYSPEWDGLWRMGGQADIVVTFADKPWRYVFWRGTRYLPSLVTAPGPAGIWSNDQGPEHFNGQCWEHMSDMLCRFSNARIIHRNDARVVVHWRNASASIGYQWPAKDANGRGIWTDEYWTIYPDGISIRHQLVHNNTEKTINCEMNQNEIFCHPGQAIEDVINEDGVIVANTEGGTQSIHRSDPPWNQRKGNWNLQLINLKGRTKQFQIGEIGAWSQTFLNNEVYWRGWTHYPVQLIPSDGTRVVTCDRPSSSCPATFHELRHMNGNHIETMVMYGLTDNPPAELTALNRSWNFAPGVTCLTGCKFRGYDRRERAFKLAKTDAAVTFTVQATREQPLENPAFVIANWEHPDGDISLKVNGRLFARGADYRTGIEADSDGTSVLVIWMPLTASETISVELGKNTR